MNVLNLARQELRQRVAYQAASPSRHYIRLHANELPWPMGDNAYHRYPKPQANELALRLATIYGIDATLVLPTRGSDDGIDLLMRGFCRARLDSVVVCPPTFSMYGSLAEIQDARIQTVPLTGPDFRLDLPRLTNLAKTPKLIFICSPNNPTGNLTPRPDIEYLCKTFGGKSLIVVDEAYVEFADVQSCASLVTKFQNLVVLRTLSKAYGLAALRCGAVIATPTIITLLNSIMSPYAIPTPCVDAALATLGKNISNQLQSRVDRIVNERQRLAKELEERTQVAKVWPSDTNFLLVKFKDANLIFDTCLNNGVLLRDFSKQSGLDNCLRISIGDARQNDLVLSSLDQAENLG